MTSLWRILCLSAMAIVALVPVPALAFSTNDFRITSFEADYYLSKDSDNRSNLKTVETIKAEFPSFDQNHGIERAIPKTYDGHSTSLKLESVKKADGSEWTYSTESQNDNLVVRIGDADSYVRGAQTYVITYSQRDVTKFFAGTNDDEFYWDTNGLGWQQPFDSLSARIHIDSSLSAALTGNQSCAQGVSGATEACQIELSDQADGAKLFVASASRPLLAGENVTFAIGFNPHSFAEYKMSDSEKLIVLAVAVFAVWFGWQWLSGMIGVSLIIWLVLRYKKNKLRISDLGTIVPEYLPPEVSVLVAAQLTDGAKNSQTAQLIDLAVRHYLKIYQTKEKGLLSDAEYELEIVKSLEDLRPEERQLVKTLFGTKTRLVMKDLKNNFSLSAELQNNDKALQKTISEPGYGLMQHDEIEGRWFKRVAKIVLVVSILTLSPMGLIVVLVAYFMSRKPLELTDKGLAVERYLLGLKMYIEVAETDRIKMLQSPDGAAKVGASVSGQDVVWLVKLYERVLPYAILFGQEKDWNKQLGRYYETLQTQPDWYTSSSAFNAAAFSSAMSGFSSASTYSAPSSSSSGGSGGGSSGGGGGGGGGGGW